MSDMRFGHIRLIRLRRLRRRGFTLTELLLVVACIGILIAMLLPVLRGRHRTPPSSIAQGRLHNLQIGYQMYAVDNDGFLLPGFQSGRMAKDVDGSVVQGNAADRYAWHLAEYLGWEWELLYPKGDVPADEIERSVYPTFGLNSWFLGGDERVAGFDAKGDDGLGLFCARRGEDVRNPDQQIVFGDSVYGVDGEAFDPVEGKGFHRIAPPVFRGSKWDLKGRKSAGDVGYLAERWDGRTVIGFFDGHYEAMKIKELVDMRFWAPRAVGSDYVVPDGP